MGFEEMSLEEKPETVEGPAGPSFWSGKDWIRLGPLEREPKRKLNQTRIVDS